MCNEFYDALSLYFDGELEEDKINEMLDHIKECDECRRAYEDYENLNSIFESIKDEPLPEKGHEKIMEAVKLSVAKPKGKLVRTANLFNKKTVGIAAVVVVVILVGAAALSSGLFGAKSAMPADAAYQYFSNSKSESDIYNSGGGYYEMQAAATEELAVAEAESPYEVQVSADTVSLRALDNNVSDENNYSKESQNAERLIIKNLYANIEVEDYNNAMNKLEGMAKAYGGYVQDSYTWEDSYSDGRIVKSGEITLKIPKEHYEAVKVGIGDLGRVYEETETSEDITSQYVETEGRLTALRTEQDRLLEILGKCDTVQELIAVEERLSQVRSEIEIYQSRLNNWDRLVQLSTVRISVKEKASPKISTKLGFGDRMREEFIYGLNSFITGCQNFVVWLAGSFLAIIVIIVIIIIIVKIIKWILRRRKKRLYEEESK